MADLRAAAQQALEYMKSIGEMDMYPADWAIVGRLEAALAQAEPVAWYGVDEPLNYMTRCADGTEFTNTAIMPAHAVSWAYTIPPQRKPLTDEEIDRITDRQWAKNNHKPVYVAHRAFARAIEAAHGIKEAK